MIKGRVIGKEGLQKKLIILSASSQANLSSEMTKLIVEMDADGKRNISSGGRSGKTYKRGSKSHIASAPGEFPKTDRGGLVAGFLFNVQKTTQKVIGILENNSSHASAVEFKPASKGGRPFMRPLYKKWKPIAESRFEIALKKSIAQAKNG